MATEFGDDFTALGDVLWPPEFAPSAEQKGEDKGAPVSGVVSADAVPTAEALLPWLLPTETALMRIEIGKPVPPISIKILRDLLQANRSYGKASRYRLRPANEDFFDDLERKYQAEFDEMLSSR